MSKMSDLDIDLQDLRAEFFDGPASDQMSFKQWLIRKGRGDLAKLGTVGRKAKGGVMRKGKGGTLARGMGKTSKGGNYRFV